jgi:hypothetical protein
MSALGRVQDELRTHPYRTLAIAAGIGCVLATRIGRSLVLPLVARAAMSMASATLAPLLQDLVEQRPA